MRMKVNHPQPEREIPTAPEGDVRELILRAQAGSREAYLALVSRYRPLLISSVARFGAAEMTLQEKADMEEEAERVFLGAVTSYDTTQESVDFGLYAKICLHNGLISEWRRQDVRRRRMPVVPLDDGEGVEEGDDPATRVVEEERFRQLCRTVRGHLSDFENRVWWQYVTGVSVSDIARDLSCEEKSVHNAIYRIRRKLREKLSEGGEG